MDVKSKRLLLFSDFFLPLLVVKILQNLIKIILLHITLDG